MPARQQRTDLERLVPIAVTAVLVAAAMLDATTRYYWVDEILTATLAGDPSLPHMLRALVDQVDTSPPLYYILAWTWARLFGVEALSLRILSALLASGAFVVLWRMLRPHASVATRAAALTAGMLVPQTVLFQVTEARSYALMMLLCAVVLAQVDALGNTEQPTRRQLIWLGVVQAALALTHTLGLMYGVASLAALVISDVTARRIRWNVIAAGSAGVIVFALWLPALRHQLQVGVPSFPIPSPTVEHLGQGLVLGYPGKVAIALSILLVIGVLIARQTEPGEAPGKTRRRLPLVLAVALWLAAALSLWLLSRTVRPLFLPRYLVPLSLAYAVALCLALQDALDRASRYSRARHDPEVRRAPAGTHLWFLLIVTLIAIAQPVQRTMKLPHSGLPGGDSLEIRHDLPIATISTHTFLPRVHYGVDPGRYVFVLDWETATRPDAPVGPTEYHLMEAMGRHYPHRRVMQADSFLAQYPRFLVIDEAGLFWFKQKIQSSPDYDVTLLYGSLLCGSGLPEDRCPVYRVERRAGAR